MCDSISVRALRQIAALSALCLVGLAAPAVAGPPDFKLTQTAVPDEDIPLYFVVMHFFDSTAHYRAELPYQYESRLVEIGVDPGSDSEDVLVDALVAAAEILERETVDLSLQDSEDEFMAYQERALEAKARDLAEVYGELIADLEATGVAPDRFRAAVDRTVRSKVSLYVEVVPGQDPTDALVAESTIRAVLPFETWSRAFYEARMNGPTTGEPSHAEETVHPVDPSDPGPRGPTHP